MGEQKLLPHSLQQYGQIQTFETDPDAKAQRQIQLLRQGPLSIGRVQTLSHQKGLCKGN
jgi:hypothetical protein